MVLTSNAFDVLANDGEDLIELVVYDGKDKEAAHETVNPNPKETGKLSPNTKEIGIQVAATVTNPNPKSTGIREVANKDQTVEWVHMTFGTLKELLNVTINQSCQEVPSQILDVPKKGIKIY